MFHNDCLECEKKLLIIDQKQKDLSLVQNNLFELKRKIIDSSTLMINYTQFKQENETLKKELLLLKANKTSSDEVGKLKYNLELLQKRFHDLNLKYENEKYKNEQLSANENDFNSKNNRVEIIKLKKIIADKDKEIQEIIKQKAFGEKKKTESAEIKFDKTEQNEKEQIDIQSKNKDEPVHIENNQNDKKIHNNVGIESTDGINLKEIIEENEFLKNKFQKYFSKYKKFKAQYRTMKISYHLIAKILENRVSNSFNLPESLEKSIPQLLNFQQKFENEANLRKDHELELKKVNINDNSAKENEDKILKNKRRSSSLDLVENDAKKGKKQSKKEKPQEKTPLKDIKKGKQKKKPNDSSDNDESINIFEKEIKKHDNSDDDDKKKRKSKRQKKSEIENEKVSDKNKKKQKIQKNSDETESEVELKTKKKKELKEKANDKKAKIKSEKEIKEKKQKSTKKNPKEEISKELEIKEHKPPTRRSKVKKDIGEDFQTNKQISLDNFINLMNSSQSNLSNDYEKYISNIIESIPIYESTNKILESILLSFGKVPLIRILYAYSVFLIQIKKSTKVNIFEILKDFISANIGKLSEEQDLNTDPEQNNLILEEYLEYVCKVNLTNLKINFHDTFKYFITNYTKTNHLTAYLIILTVLSNNEYISEYYKIAFEYLENYNFIKFEFLAITGICLKDIFEAKHEKNTSFKKNSSNKIYILGKIKNDLVSTNSVSFINNIIGFEIIKNNFKLDKNIDNIIENKELKLIDFNSYVMELIEAKFESLDSIILNNNSFDKINLGDPKIVELYQIFITLIKLKDESWINELIFENLLRRDFVECQTGSLKRIVIIFFVGFVMNYFVANDIQFTKQYTLDSIRWIYSILDPTFEVDKITFYDKITSLACLVDLVKINDEISRIVSLSVNSILTKYQNSKDLIPTDLKEKLTRYHII